MEVPAAHRLRAVGGPPLVAHVCDLVAAARGALQGAVGAAYVIGSIASGDERGPLTDLDLVLVTDSRPGVRDRRAAGERLADVATGSPLPRVEAVLYRRAALARPTYPLPYEVNVNAGPASARRVTTTGDEHFWFLLDVAAAREHALVLHGPPAAELIGPVPDTLVVRALGEALAWHGRHPAVGPDAVLGACRAWHWLERRRWLSKTAAGEWALRQQPAPEVVDAVQRAVAARRAHRDIVLDAHAVGAVIAAVHRRLASERPAAALPRNGPPASDAQQVTDG